MWLIDQLYIELGYLAKSLSNYEPPFKKFHNPTDPDMYKAAWHT